MWLVLAHVAAELVGAVMALLFIAVAYPPISARMFGEDDQPGAARGPAERL